MKTVGEYKIGEEKICSGASINDCLICSKSKKLACSYVSNLLLFDALGVEGVTRILSPKELKYEEKSIKDERIVVKFKKRKKFIDQSWNYLGADTKYFTHCFHR